MDDLMEGPEKTLVIAGVGVALLAAVVLYKLWRDWREWRDRPDGARARAREDALFASMFPELQPCLHPAMMWDYVKARRNVPSGWRESRWMRPPGFSRAGVAVAELALDQVPERTRLLDANGAVLGEFGFEPHPEGGLLRVGEGKVTVSLEPEDPRVRYWHPRRQFKWSKRKGWRFTTPVADRPIGTRPDASDSPSSSFDSGSSSSTAARGTAAAAGAAALVAAGGTFDGGGASAGWDGGGGAGTSY